MPLPLKWIPAAAYGGPFRAPAASCVVVHCTESDNTPAMAEALAGPGWFGGPKAGTSAHKVVDVDSICEGVKRGTVAYHAGPGGNTWGIAYEFCGYASWSAAKWREPAQLQMLRNAAPHIADDLRSIGAPARWLSLAQLAAHAKGMCTHNDIRLALGGTTHSDPGPNFPYAELLAYVQAELNGTPIEEDDMFDDHDRRALNEVWQLLKGDHPYKDGDVRANGDRIADNFDAIKAAGLDSLVFNVVGGDASEPARVALGHLEERLGWNLQAQRAAYETALTALAGGRPIDLQAIADAAEQGARNALQAGVDVDITVGGQHITS